MESKEIAKNLMEEAKKIMDDRLLERKNTSEYVERMDLALIKENFTIENKENVFETDGEWEWFVDEVAPVIEEIKKSNKYDSVALNLVYYENSELIDSEQTNAFPLNDDLPPGSPQSEEEFQETMNERAEGLMKNYEDNQRGKMSASIKTKSAFIEISKGGKEWKITSSKLNRPLTTESVVKATGYLTRICKRLNISSAAHALEHAKNIGKYVIAAGDTYGPNPAEGNAFSSPISREPVNAITTGEKPYAVFCETCNIQMVPEQNDQQQDIRDSYVCPDCQWPADLSGIQEPSLTSDPLHYPLTGPTDYEKGGNAFKNYSGYKGNGFYVKAVDEEKKEKKKERESGLDSSQRAAINSKLEDANKMVREYLVTVQVIQQEVKNYQQELAEALELKELKKQADLLSPAIKEMLDQLAEHEKQIQGVEYRLKDAHNRTNIKSKEEVDPIIEQIKKLVAPENVKEFDELRKELYKSTPIKESFTYELSKQSPEVAEEINELKKTIELLKTKKDLPKEEIEKIEEQEVSNETPEQKSSDINGRIDKLVEAGLLEDEIAKGLKESYKKDPKSIRKHIRKMEAKLNPADDVKTEDSKEEKPAASAPLKEFSYREFIKDVSGVKLEKGGTGEVKKGSKVFINGIHNDEDVTFSHNGDAFLSTIKFMEENTKPTSNKQASLNLKAADLADQIAEYWEKVKVFFKDIIKPFTNFLTISNSEWKDVNDQIDESFGLLESSDEEPVAEKKAASFKLEAEAPKTPNLILTFKNVQQNLEQIEEWLNNFKDDGEIISWELKNADVEKDTNEYLIVPQDTNTKDILVLEFRDGFEPLDFFIKEASLKKTACKINVSTKTDDSVIIEIVAEEGETSDSLWEKLSANMEKGPEGDVEDILQSWTENENGFDALYVEVLTPDENEAKDIIEGALHGGSK